MVWSRTEGSQGEVEDLDGESDGGGNGRARLMTGLAAGESEGEGRVISPDIVSLSSDGCGCQILLSMRESLWLGDGGVGERCSGEVAGLVTDPVGREGARLMTGLVEVRGTRLLTDLGRECGGAWLETDLAVEGGAAGGT